jgi:hypothetical protein
MFPPFFPRRIEITAKAIAVCLLRETFRRTPLGFESSPTRHLTRYFADVLEVDLEHDSSPRGESAPVDEGIGYDDNFRSA